MSGSSKDVRAGGAFVEIWGKDRLSTMINKMKKRLDGFASGIISIGRTISIGAGIAFAPLAALFKGGVSRGEQIDLMSKKLGMAADQYQRLAYAAEIAGVSIDDVLDNPGRFQDLMDGAPIMDAATIRDSAKSNQELRKAIVDLQGALAPLVSYLVPYIQWVRDLIADNPKVARTLFIGAAAALGFSIAIITGGMAIKGFALLLKGGSVAVWALIATLKLVPALVAGMFAAITSPIGLTIAAIVAVMAVLITQIERGKEELISLRDLGTEVWGDLKQGWTGVVSAISRGDFAAAFEVATATMKLVWARTIDWFTVRWALFKNTFVDGWVKAVDWVAQRLAEVFAFFERKWNAITDAVGLGDELGTGRTDAEINKERDQIKKNLDEDRERELKEREEARLKNIRDAMADLERAKANFKEVTEVEKKKAAAFAAGKMKAEDDPHHPGLSQITAVRGAFRIVNGNQQFAEGTNLAKKQLAEQQKAGGFLAAIIKAIEAQTKKLEFK